MFGEFKENPYERPSSPPPSQIITDEQIRSKGAPNIKEEHARAILKMKNTKKNGGKSGSVKFFKLLPIQPPTTVKQRKRHNENTDINQLAQRFVSQCKINAASKANNPS